MTTHQLSEGQRAFFRDNPFPAVVTTVRHDGTPHSTVVWLDEVGGDILFNTAEGRAKPRELRENPHVALMMIDPNDMYRWVALTGRAELSHEGAREHIDKLSKKYLGKDEYPFYQGEERVIVRIKVDRVDSFGVE